MSLTAEQVLALAPDPAAAVAGRKLGVRRPWRNLGRSERALWGECQGTALYQVRADLSDLAAHCSCPSSKNPCKHSLGLMLLAANEPDALPEAAEPDWVAEWLTKRAAAAARRAKRAESFDPEAPELAREQRAEKRLQRVREGIEGLDLWLGDVIRGGLAALESQSFLFWEAQASRMVDAQAPGLASRLRRMAWISRSHPDWPERLLRELGKLALLTQAFRRLDELDPPLREDVRRLVGFNLPLEEVLSGPDVVSDHWLVLAQTLEENERVRTQRSWLFGEASGRRALVLQFAAGEASFPEPLAPGTRLEADLAFWPSAWPQRALIRERRGGAEPLRAVPTIAGTETVDALLSEAAEALSRLPWIERLLFVLNAVIPVPDPAPDPIAGPWRVVDRQGQALRLAAGDPWPLLALSGGRPVDLVGEWDGEALIPLAVIGEGIYLPLRRTG